MSRFVSRTVAEVDGIVYISFYRDFGCIVYTSFYSDFGWDVV